MKEMIRLLQERTEGERWLSDSVDPAGDLAYVVSAISHRVAEAIETNAVDVTALRTHLRDQLSLTDACVMAALFLQANELTPFEFSIWLAGGR